MPEPVWCEPCRGWTDHTFEGHDEWLATWGAAKAAGPAINRPGFLHNHAPDGQECPACEAAEDDRIEAAAELLLENGWVLSKEDPLESLRPHLKAVESGAADGAELVYKDRVKITLERIPGPDPRATAALADLGRRVDEACEAIVMDGGEEVVTPYERHRVAVAILATLAPNMMKAAAHG